MEEKDKGRCWGCSCPLLTFPFRWKMALHTALASHSGPSSLTMAAAMGSGPPGGWVTAFGPLHWLDVDKIWQYVCWRDWVLSSSLWGKAGNPCVFSSPGPPHRRASHQVCYRARSLFSSPIKQWDFWFSTHLSYFLLGAGPGWEEGWQYLDLLKDLVRKKLWKQHFKGSELFPPPQHFPCFKQNIGSWSTELEFESGHCLLCGR
jgi:hypothetical protein